MDVPEEVIEQLTDIQSALHDVEEHLQPFLEAGPKEITAQLTPLERLKAHLALAQAAVVLYQLDRQLDAANLDKHPLQKELERLAKYERTVQEAVTADELARTKPGTSLNIAAANRFIDAAIPDLTQQQKAALRGLNKRPAAETPTQDEPGGRSTPGRQSSRANPSKQQQEGQQGQKKKKQKGAGGPVNAQEFLQEIVTEAAQQEEEQQPKQQEQPQGGAGGGSESLSRGQQGGGGEGVVVDADAFLQDIMAEVDKQQ